MLKPLHKNDTLTTPFVATKNWNLSNVANEDLVLTEHSGSPVALEFLDYTPTSSVTGSACNIALEQQTSDRILYREGQQASGLFYTSSEQVNVDGTYKRLVYSQVQNMFYNNYRDPTKIWGLEYLDFDISQTKRFLSEKFKLYDVPVDIFGEKIVPNTIVIYEQETDNDYTITDDGHGNLYAIKNLFSRQQEIGDFTNEFRTGSNDDCYCYFFHYEPEKIVTVSGPVPTASIGVSLHGGSAVSSPYTFEFSMEIGLASGSTTRMILTSSAYDSASVSIGFYTGSINNVIVWMSASDSGSVNMGFYTGSINNVILPSSAGDSGSVDMGFYTGSIATVASAISGSEVFSLEVGLSSGTLS